MTNDWSLALPMPDESADTDAVSRLVTGYGALLFRVAHSVLRNSAEAEDVVQDTFVRVLQRRQQLPEVREMRLWLVRITWNLALDRQRRIRPEQMDELFAERLTSTEAATEKMFCDAQQVRRVLQAVDRLPVLERKVLLLTGVHELRTEEVASLCKKSESAVRALLFRARARLRERLQRMDRSVP